MEDQLRAFMSGASSSNANVISQVNLDNEMGTTVKPPKLMSMDEYEAWKEKFTYWVQAMHFAGWVSIERGYTVPVDENNQVLEKYNYSTVQRDEYIAEKKMISLIQQSVKEDILILLPEYNTARDLWLSLQKKYQGSAEMIKSKKALILKEFDIFTMIKNETIKQMIERFCHLKVQMRRHGLEKTELEYIDKLADALPEGEWTTYLMVLKNSDKWDFFKLSTFIDKLEGHEMELLKMAKSKNANVVQDIGLYYKT